MNVLKCLLRIAMLVQGLVLAGPVWAQVHAYDFVWYSGASQTWVYEAGARMRLEVLEDPNTPENDVLLRVRNELFTDLSYLSSISDLQIDTGSLFPGVLTSLEIVPALSLGSFSYEVYPVGSRSTLLDGWGRVTGTGDHAAGRVPNAGKPGGINRGEYLVFRAMLRDGVTFADLIAAIDKGLASNYTTGHYGQWTTAQRTVYRAEAVQGFRMIILVHSTVPNTWHQDGHGLFVTHKRVDSTDPSALQINEATASPPAILDNQVSQLVVSAFDPIPGPAALSYQWSVVSGGGFIDNSTSSSAVFVPADVVGTQVAKLRVTVSDGAASVTRDVTVTVQDATPPPPGPQLLSQDFSSSVLGAWTVVTDGASTTAGRWVVSAGELQQSTNLAFGSTSASDLVRAGTYLRYDAGSSWKNYRVKYKMRSTDDDGIGLMFRVADNDNYYRFSWDRQMMQRRLVKKSGGAFSLLAADNVQYVIGQSYQIEIVANGTQLEVWVDGVRIFQVSDIGLAQGTIAFYTWRNNGAYFDDVVVEDLDGGVANLPPQITALSASPATIYETQQSQVSVAVTDPDGGPGPLTYQWTVVDGAGMLQSSTNSSAWYYPADVFGTQTVTLRVRVSDGTASVSGDVTLTVLDSTPPPPGPQLLSQDFSSSVLGAWTVVTDGASTTAGRWVVSAGELQQTTNLAFGSTSASDLVRAGTYLRYDGGSSWKNYRVKYKMRSTDNDGIGLMFRVADNDNYYRFSWDREMMQRRLVRKSGGAFSLLAADNVQYVIGQSYQIEIVANGTQLEVWVDGVRIFQVSDTGLAQGAIAFYTWRNNGAYFDDLVVTGID